MSTVNKFGNVEDESEEADIITPYFSYATNLDDLENVEGFNSDGNKNGIYGFKLNERGLYQRSEVITATLESLFNPDNVDARTLLNIVYHNKKWKLIKTKHDWDINIKIKNNTVSCKGDTIQILRIYNSGKMLGNLVPLKNFKEHAILKKHQGEYFLAAKKGDAAYEFKTKFEQDKELLKIPPEGSTFYIEGFLLDNMEEEDLFENFKISIVGLDSPKPFWIQITKNKSNCSTKSFPEELKLTETSPNNINLNKIRIHQDKYLISRIAFTTIPIKKNEIYYL